jgi:hypothetical protein
MLLSDLHQGKSILGNCQIPEFSSPNKIFFMIHEAGCAKAIILLTSRILVFVFPGLAII